MSTEDLAEEPAERAAYRQQVTAWFEANATPKQPAGLWDIAGFVDDAEAEEHFDQGRRWQRALFDAGYAGVAWPAEYGGGGGEAWQAKIVSEVGAGYEESPGFIDSTIAMLGPTLLAHGSEEQKREILPKLLSAEVTFCQLFSEPGAGSDLASLATRAVRDGDEYAVNGQKVWNSSAQFCDWGFLLVRTDPDVPKHQGISFLLVDMSTPGIEVRPLIQANGSSHFNEVFLSDVRVPVDQIVGEENAGWAPTRTVLGNEAAFIGRGRMASSDRLIALGRLGGVLDDELARQDIATVITREKLIGLMGERIQHAVRQGKPPPIDGSLIKLYATDTRILSGDIAMRLSGAAGMVTEEEQHRWSQGELINRFGISIGGGTSEVQRNNLAERALGLPREPRPDKDLPFTELLRS